MTSKKVTSLSYERAKRSPPFEVVAERAKPQMMLAAEEVRKVLEKHGVREVSVKAVCKAGTIFVSVGNYESVQIHPSPEG